MVMYHVTLIKYFVLTISYAYAVEFISHNPVNATRKAVTTSGTILFGGLFPIHSKAEGSTSNLCGKLSHERGIHRLEAMLYAVDMVNKNKSILPHQTIGVDIRDTCGVDTHALEESVQFIKGSPENNGGNCAQYKAQTRISGVIGAASSGVSIQVANLLRLFSMPQISYASTSPDLNDRKRYEYFLRTVPPDTYQARAMLDILKHFKWKSVHGIYSEGNYGRKGMEEFKMLAKKNGICVVTSEGVNDKSNYRSIVEGMTKFENTRVVVLFLSTRHISLLLKATKDAKNAKIAAQAKSEDMKKYDFKWLASDYWGTRLKFIKDDNLQQTAKGAITLTLQTKQVKDFKQYFRNLTPASNQRNPWFKTFWEETFNCSLSKKPPSGVSQCSGNETLPADYSLDDKVPYVVDAVKSLAYALHNVIVKSTSCKPADTKCQLDSFQGDKVLNSLRNITFQGELGLNTFDENGSTVRKYEIFEFDTEPTEKYKKVGSWLHRLNISDLKETVTSSCSVECKSGQRRMPKYGMTCCYTCEDCGKDQYAQDEKHCKTCSEWERPNSTRTGCESLPEQPIDSAWVIIMTTISSLGIIVTFVIILIFIYHNNTAVVKASGRELSYPLLFGIILCYSLPFVLLAEPSPTSCGLTRFGLGFGFFVCYAALVTKTNRIERIFRLHNGPKIESPLMVGPSSQILIMTVAVLLQALLAVVGLFLHSPTTYYVTDDAKKYKMKLCVLPNYDVGVAFSCNILLIVVCTVFAFRTRKVPACFNEAKYIGFVMYTTCVIWIAFITVYFGLKVDYRFVAICMNIFLSATSILAGVFGPKIYIIIFRPARNNRSRSGLSVRHAYSNQSFEPEFTSQAANSRRMTAMTEVELERTRPTNHISL